MDRLLGPQVNTVNVLPLAVRKGMNDTADEISKHKKKPKNSKSHLTVANEAAIDSRHGSIFHAARKGSLASISDILDLGPNVDQHDASGYTALHHAVMENRTESIEMLLGHRANVNARNKEGSTPLHIAARYNFVDAAKLLVSHGAEIMAQNNLGSTPFHAAVRRDNHEVTELLLDQPRLLINEPDHDGFTAVHLACINGSVGLCELLLSRNASVNVASKDGRMPIHMAAYQGDATIVKKLIDKAKKRSLDIYRYVNSSDMQYYTPLHYAASNGHTSVVDVLIENGGQVDADTSGLSKPIHLAGIGGHQGVIELLLIRGSRVDDVDIEQRTALHRAANYGREAVIQVLLDKGGKVDNRDERGMTPLLYAVQNGYFDAADLLLRHKANIGIQDTSGKSCLHYAVETQILTGIELMLENGAKSLLEMTDNTEKTPLHYAAALGNIKTVRLLIASGSEINPRDESQQTPLHIAAEKGHLEVVDTLMKRAPLDSTDESNKTPLHLAALGGKRKICLSLIRMGAKVNAQDEKLQSPLHMAAGRGYEKTVIALLDNDAIVDLTDKNKNTPLHHAAARGHVTVVDLLLERGADVKILNVGGQSCLDVAIDHSEDAAMTMIKHRRWQEILECTSTINPIPLKSLIAQLPDVAEEVMNRCVETTNLQKTHSDYSITYNFRLLDPGSDPQKNRRKQKFFGPSVMVEHKRESLLLHPLSMTLLQMKWNRFGRWPYYINLVSFVFFIGLYTYYVIQKRRGQETGSSISLSEISSNAHRIGFYVIIFASFQILGEVMQIFVQGRKYFKSLSNYVDWLMYLSCFFFIAPNLTNTCCFRKLEQDDDLYWTIAIVSIFLTWFNMFLIMRQFSGLGIYISMMFDVFNTVLKACFAFASFILSFTIIFHILLYDLPEFHGFGDSLMKVTVMTIGEMDYSSTIFENLNQTNEATGKPMIPQPETTRVVFYIFSILMPIILMNLLIGLAVGDIDTIQKNAQMEKLAMRVSYVRDMENKFPSSIARWLNVPELVVKPNKQIIQSCWTTFVAKIKSLCTRSGPLTVFEWELDYEVESERNIVYRELRKQKKKMKSMSSMLQRQQEMLEHIIARLDSKPGQLHEGTLMSVGEHEFSTIIEHHRRETGSFS